MYIPDCGVIKQGNLDIEKIYQGDDILWPANEYFIYYWTRDGQPIELRTDYPFNPEAIVISNVYQDGMGTITIRGKLTAVKLAFNRDPGKITKLILPEGIEEILNPGLNSMTNLTALTLPSTLKIIDNSFQELFALETLTLPQGLQEIRGSAFYRCLALKSLVIPDSVTRFDLAGGDTFYGCSSLEKIVLGNGITYINERAFTNLSALSAFTMGSGVTWIGMDVFYGCSHLRELDYVGTMAQWEAIDKSPWWNDGSHISVVHCSDGDIDPPTPPDP